MFLRTLCCLLLAVTLATPGQSPCHRTAVLDRFEGDTAVLVFDDGDRRLSVPRTSLPVAGRHVDAVFDVSVAHGSLTSARYDPRTTRRRERCARQRFATLARPSDGGESPANAEPSATVVAPGGRSESCPSVGDS